MKAQGVARSVGEQVVQRDSGCCVVWITHPGQARPYEQIHHRRPRAMGGTRVEEVNSCANLVCVCRPCHDWLESHRTEALSRGWLLGGSHDRPSSAPLLYRERWMYLTADGQAVRFLQTPWKDDGGPR